MDNTGDDESEATLAALMPRDGQASMQMPIVIATSVVVALATVATGLRAYVRRLILRQWGMDDTASMISYVLVLTTGVLIALSTKYGIGTPLSTISPEDYRIASLLSKCSIVTYQASVTALKATFLLQYRRIFPLPNFQRLCDVLFWFNLLFGLSLILSFALRCRPPSSAWTGQRIGTHCIKMLVWWYVNAGVNLCTDIIILVMPLPMLRSLPLARKPKLILIGIFGLGIFTTAISIVRITSLKHAATSRDDTYAASLSAIFAIVELCCATICVCTPTLRPLIGSAKRQLSSLRGNKSSVSNVAASHGDSSTATSGANSDRLHRALSPALQAFHSKSHGEMEHARRRPRPSQAMEDGAPTAVAAFRRDLSMAWTVGTGTETDDDFEEFDIGDEDLPTVLYPPPRSHAARGSFSTSLAGRSMRSMGVEDSPVLKGAARP